MSRVTLLWAALPGSLGRVQMSTLRDARWLYVGRNYVRLRHWERQLSPRHRLRLGDELQDTAMELRRPFIEFMASHAAVNDADAYWSSPVFENSTTASTLFLECCWLAIVRRLLRRASGAGDLLIVAENPAFLDAVAGNVPHGSSVSRVWPQGHGLRRWSQRAALPAKVLRFAVASGREWLAAVRTRAARAPQPAGPIAVVRTWVQRTWVDASDQTRVDEKYLPGLVDFLQSHGVATLQLPLCASGGLWPVDFVGRLRTQRAPFLIPWDYLRVGDVLAAVVTGCRQARLRWASTRLAEMEIVRLLCDERRKYALSTRGLLHILQSRLPPRLRAAGIQIERVIYPFENSLPEKALVTGMRRGVPEAILIGFQHSVLFPLKLDLFADGRQEATRRQLPDRVVCSGRVFADRLRIEYAPYDRFETGPALRCAHLVQESAAAESRGADVLVVVPGWVNEATELLTKLAEAMRDPIPASVLIKPHPALPMPRLRELVPEIDDIPRLAVVSGSMGDALARAAVAVTLASSAIVDAIAAGVPVCRVRRDTDLDMDPALWLDVPADVCPAASTAEELRAALLDCVAMPPERRARLTAFARRFRKHALGAIENEAFAGFVRDTKNRDGEPRRATALKAG